jgi:hypothetical protein
VTARVPGIASLMTGRPVSSVVWSISIMPSNLASGASKVGAVATSTA